MYDLMGSDPFWSQFEKNRVEFSEGSKVKSARNECILSYSPFLNNYYINNHNIGLHRGVNAKFHLSLSHTNLIRACGPNHISPAQMTSTLFLRRPLFAGPSTLPCNVIFAILFVSMWSTWPNHWCCLSCTFYSIASVWLRAFLMSITTLIITI